MRDAATVVLIRDGDPGLEVFLMRRVRAMAFAGGMTVFPGGGVDLRDAEQDLDWQGEQPQWWAREFATDTATATALVAAAVRETFEECGVLLASDAAGRFPAPGDLAQARADLVAKDLSLAGLLRSRNLTLRADLLRPMAHWVTPESEPRRYDTRFFLAALPEGQEADGRTTEALSTGWATPAHALAEWERHHHMLLPPTWTQLTDLAAYSCVEDALAAHRPITAIMPTQVSDGTVPLAFDGAQDYFRFARL